MKPIRNSAKAVIVDGDKVLLTKNVDDEGIFYLFPGGGQEPGEELSRALVRECLEEIGQEVRVGELLWVREYIGKNHQFAKWDSDIHQVEFYFRCALMSENAVITNGNNPDSYQIGVEWVRIDTLEKIRVFPGQLGRMLKERVGGMVYLGDVN